MERLTKRSSDTTHENGVCCTHFGGPECCEVEGNCAVGCPWEEAAWERLCDYEDTRLTSAEVLSMSAEWRAMMSVLNSIGSYDRLRELAKADREGRVVVLPCKVGDVVYGFHNNRLTILPMVAKWIETNADGWTVEAQYAPMAPKFYQFSDFGKTVFLTREEAEKALEAKRDVCP